MLASVDHIVLHVSDLESAVTRYRRLGFHVATPHPSSSVSDNAYIVVGDFYLQLHSGGPADEPSEIVLSTDDLDAEMGRVRSAGFQITDIHEHPIDGEGGSLFSRRATVDLAARVGFAEHDHDADARLHYLGGRHTHPNTATALERAYVAVESMEHDLPVFEQVFGAPAPTPEMGTVIMSLMSVFYFGDIGIAVAEPRGPGPTADALEANGPGLFQVLFRVEHLDDAARVIADNGAPQPERGTRLSGESALLNLPSNACDAYVALAGPD